MAAMRLRLPNRRQCTTFKFEHESHRFLASVGHFEDGAPAELFINTEGKTGSASDINASDAAVAVSLALQHGCSVATLKAAMRRNPDGTPAGPLAHALDLIDEAMNLGGV